MKYLSLFVFLFIFSCSRSERSFSSIDDARESIAVFVDEADVDSFMSYSDRSNLPDHVTENLEDVITGLFTAVGSKECSEVLSFSNEEYDAYCIAELEKIPESIRDNFKDRPSWNRSPERFLVFRYGSSEQSTFDLTIALFKVNSGWRIASGYYPDKN